MEKKVKKTRTKSKHNYKLARSFRFAARSLLTIGILFLVSIYISMACFSLSGHSLSHHYGTVLPQFAAVTFSPLQLFIYGFTTVVIIIGALVLLYCTNSMLRSANRFVANFFGIHVFVYELAISFTVWALATALLLFFLPYAAPYTIIGLILNQLCFCFAFLAYRRPNYVI